MGTSSVADLFVVLDSVTDPFSRGMKAAAADAEAQSHRMSSALGAVTKIGLGLGAAAVGVGVASVKMATDFQAKMTLLNTQAGVAKNQIGSLSDGVLNLAGQVGFAPNSLAEALYHIESSFGSTGITGSQALNMLKVAAEGAAIGHANLVDVTNALDAAVVSGIPGVQDLTDAMGQMNAAVGQGDMSMQDFADAFSTGLLANVKSYGLTFTDVSAALEVFGDNNMRGQLAATDLRMAVQAMAKPASTASVELQKMGLQSDSLAKVMSQQGLLPALQLLHDRMTAIGVTAKDQGQVLTDLFGKKAGAGIVVLYDQLGRLESKYPDLEKGASGFSSAWEETKNTFSRQIKDIGAGVDALGVRIGTWLIPQVSNLITTVQGAGSGFLSGFTGSALKPVQHAPAHNAFMNQELSAPSLTGWQEFGQEVHRVLTDVEQGAKKLEPIGADFVRFGDEVYQGAVKLVPALKPTAELLGTGLVVGLAGVGKVLANVVGPAFKDLAEFIDGHQRLFEFFAVTVLGGLATKMAVLGTINAAKGLLNLATAVVQFPLQQTGQITTAWGEMKTAWTGQEAAQGEQALQGLSGAMTELKTSTGAALDRFTMFNASHLAGLAQAGQDIGAIEKAAASAPQQLSLFETDLSGIVQVAEKGPQQLSLFETEVNNVGTVAAETESSVSGLSGALGKFALAGGVIGAAIVGIQMLDEATSHLMGVGAHAADTVEQYSSQLQLAANGSLSAADDFAKSAVQMALTSHLAGAQVGGMKNIDQAMAQMVSGGNAQAAQSEFARIADALHNQGFNAQQTADEFPQYERALKDAGTAAATMTGQVQNSIDAMQHQQTLDQFSSDLANLTQTINDNGKALSGNSTQAQQNITAFRGMALESLQFYQDQINAHTPIDQANKDLANQYNALEAVGIQFLGSKKKADDFLTSLNMIKPSYSTSINLDTSHAVSTFSGLLETINSSTATVHLAVSQTGLGMGTGRGAATPGFDDGGFANWAKGAPRLAVLHGGEYVVSNDMQAGRQQMDPRVLSGVGARLSGYVGPAGGGSGATVVNNYYTVNVAGSVLSQMELEKVLRTQVLQYKNRNSGNGWG